MQSGLTVGKAANTATGEQSVEVNSNFRFERKGTAPWRQRMSRAVTDRPRPVAALGSRYCSVAGSLDLKPHPTGASSAPFVAVVVVLFCHRLNSVVCSCASLARFFLVRRGSIPNK